MGMQTFSFGERLLSEVNLQSLLLARRETREAMMAQEGEERAVQIAKAYNQVRARLAATERELKVAVTRLAEADAHLAFAEDRLRKVI